MSDLFSDPHESDIARAHSDGLLNWHREDISNPYVVAGEPIHPLLAWAWDLGRREGQSIHGRRRAALSDTERRLESEGFGLFGFRRAAGGGA